MSQEQTTSSAGDLSKSKFYMWRCVVAMAHADDFISPEESDYLKNLFGNLRDKAGLSEEEHQILMDDLATSQEIENLLPKIVEPEYRGQVVYFARLLAYADDDLHESEEALLDKLHANAMKNIDIDALRAEVRSIVQGELAAHEAENIDSARPDKIGLSWLLDRFLLRLGIDLMDE